jgi:transcription-repair coupling factor (superfamily II helicase)
MRDLEIRGAGNLLGAEQSGHIAAVGFDLYVEMVTEAVGELTGELPEHPAEVQIDLPVTAHLPRDYIARDDVRMEAYRRLAAVTTPADVDDVRAEEDGLAAAGPAGRLLDVSACAASLRLGIRAVSAEGPRSSRRLAPAQVAAATAAHGRAGAGPPRRARRRSRQR